MGATLRILTVFLARRALDFVTVGRKDIEAYLVWCDAQGLAKSTRARRLSAIKQLYRFAFEEGWRSDNPAIQIAGPGQDKRLPKVLSEDEVDQLLDAARHSGRKHLGPAPQHLFDGAALRHRHAGERAGEP